MSITIVSSFIIQANVIPIVNYDHKTFIVQATGMASVMKQKSFQKFVTMTNLLYNRHVAKVLWHILTKTRPRFCGSELNQTILKALFSCSSWGIWRMLNVELKWFVKQRVVERVIKRRIDEMMCYWNDMLMKWCTVGRMHWWKDVSTK